MRVYLPNPARLPVEVPATTRLRFVMHAPIQVHSSHHTRNVIKGKVHFELLLENCLQFKGVDSPTAISVDFVETGSHLIITQHVKHAFS